jgi:hypothetical protein
MAKLIEASGSLTVQSDVAVSGQGSCVRQLSLGPGGSSSGQRFFQKESHDETEIATSGAVGAVFEDLDVLDGFSEIDLLFLRSSAQVALRLYALPAVMQAVAGVFPTLFGGGETVTITVDGSAVVVTFEVGDQSALQCAARINSAMALAGLATPRASVVSGQLRLEGVATKVASGGAGQITVAAGAPATQLGLASGSSPVVTDAQGQDVTVSGLCMMEFPNTGSRLLTKVQVSGQASLDVLAAGRA